MANSRMTLPGIIAAILLVGGTVWGILCGCLLSLSFESWDDNGERFWVGVIEFLPGYLITLAYGIRSFSFPWWIVRQGIWVALIIVQGAWLSTLGQFALEDYGVDGLTLWWSFAILASLVALLIEPMEAPWRVSDRERLSKALPADA